MQPISFDCTIRHNTVLWASALHCTGDCCNVLATGSEQEQMAGTYKSGNGPSGSIKSGEFLHQFTEYQLASQEGLCPMEEVLQATA